MSRIIAGSAGGRRVSTPSGTATRPTTDRVREALFSSLGDLTGATVLDLYAGSGALGLEALSRGAAKATFVESDPATTGIVRRNLETLGLAGGQVLTMTVERFLAGTAEPYDVVLADPPYALDIDPILAALPGWVGGTVVVERATRDDPPNWPPELGLVRSRAYGETTLWYGREL